MDSERPDYIPAPIWDRYREIAESGAKEADLRPLRRLLGLEGEDEERKGIRLTWRHLVRQIKEHGRPGRDHEDWIDLLEAFLLAVNSFDRSAFEARRQARKLFAIIASTAGQLAEALRTYRGLKGKSPLMNLPIEGWFTDAWINTAVDNTRGREDPFEHPSDHFPPAYGGLGPSGREAPSLPAPAEMVQALADAFNGFEPEGDAIFADYINTPQLSNATALVNHFGSVWGLLDFKSAWAGRFEIGATDLARILTALSGFKVSRELVNQVRWKQPNRKD